MDNLIEKVEKWFIDRGLDKANPTKQMLKLYEEMGEVSAGLARNDIDEIKDGIGDVLVVLIGLSMQLGISVEECLNVAYYEIKDRKGKLVEGVFIKEEDLSIEDKDYATKKYYLRLPNAHTKELNYLNYDVDLKTYRFYDSDESIYVKTKFTQKEIDKMQNQALIKTLIKEEV